MTKTLTGLIAVATLATATAAVPTTAQERCVGCGIGAPEYPIAPPGYVYYPAYWEPLPGANCYWFPHPGLRRSRQHGRLARASRGVLLLVIRLSSVAAALMKKCKTDRVEKLGPGCGYGFNITNDWGKPLVLFAYNTQGAAEAAWAQIKLAIEEAYDVRPWDEWGVGGLSKDDKF